MLSTAAPIQLLYQLMNLLVFTKPEPSASRWCIRLICKTAEECRALKASSRMFHLSSLER